MKKFSLILILLIALNACGRKNDPEAPEVFALRAVSAVDIQCDNDSINLSWAAPLRNKNESSILKSFFLKRKVLHNNIEGNLEDLGIISATVTNNKINSPQTRYQYEDRQISYGNSYKYYISAVDSEGQEGAIDVIYKVNYVQGACIVEPLSPAKEGGRF